MVRSYYNKFKIKLKKKKKQKKKKNKTKPYDQYHMYNKT